MIDDYNTLFNIVIIISLILVGYGLSNMISEQIICGGLKDTSSCQYESCAYEQTKSRINKNNYLDCLLINQLENELHSASAGQ